MSRQISEELSVVEWRLKLLKDRLIHPANQQGASEGGANKSRVTPLENLGPTVNLSDINDFRKVAESIKDLELLAIRCESVINIPLVNFLTNNQKAAGFKRAGHP